MSYDWNSRKNVRELLQNCIFFKNDLLTYVFYKNFLSFLIYYESLLIISHFLGQNLDIDLECQTIIDN